MNKIGIIGFGNMGSCLAKRLKSEQNQIWVYDKDRQKTEDILNLNLAQESKNLIEAVDVVMLAVKPQDFNIALSEIKDFIDDKLVISIAAGISTAFIEKNLGQVRVIRTMPNMAARVGRAMTCICKGKFAREEDLNFAQNLFLKLGETLILDEGMMNEATAVSGSGPGYIFDGIENRNIDINDQESLNRFNEEFVALLKEAAIYIGFLPQQASKLAQATVEGSLALLKESNLCAAELKKQITSKGGTTEAALKVIHRGGDLKEAVKAAVLRARELEKT